MKLLISTLFFLPTFAFAAAKTVTLPLVNKSDLNDGILCIYAADVSLGDANNVKPFQLLARQENGSFAMLAKPDVIKYSNNGQFYTKASTVKSVQKNQTCPTSAELILVQ